VVRCHPSVCFSVNDTPTLSLFPTLPLAHSLTDNEIGAKGATALAAVLKQTQITNLECAAALSVHLSVDALDTRLLALYPTPAFTAWNPTSSVALTMMVTASTPLRASPSCARGSRGAP
jgi:hypothetical protein